MADLPAPGASGAVWVVGFDGSAPAWRAAQLAVELARYTRARVTLVYVRHPDPRVAEPVTEEESDAPSRALGRAMESLVKSALEVGVAADGRTAEGSPAEVLLELARSGRATALFVGTRGPTGERRMLGSVSGHVASLSPVPVTVVP